MAAEESKTCEKTEKPTITVPNLSINTTKTLSRSTSSIPSSPLGLRKTSSVRNSCLCSPTTHVGSFRCRYHRNSSLSSMSVGSKLSELAGNVGHNEGS